MPTNLAADIDYGDGFQPSDAGQNERVIQKKQDDDDEEDTGTYVHLKKQLGLISGVGLIVGTMIGSGIFISPISVLKRTGSVGLSLVVWTGCGVLAMLGSLCYCELGTMIPLSGCEYAYLMEAFGRSKRHTFLSPIPAYLYSWTAVFIMKPSSLAIICLAFGEYAMSPLFGDCGAPKILVKLTTVGAVLLLTAINCMSVKSATRLQNVFMFAKLLALAIIIVGGIVNLCRGTATSPSSVALAFYSGLWAYDGWNNLNFVTEELRSPSKNLPRSIMIGIPLVTIVYVLTNISYFTVMSKSAMLASDAVAVSWSNSMLGVMAWIIPLSVACSTFGAANGSMFGAGRLCLVSAREGHLPSIISYISIKYFTPAPALIFQTIVAIIMVTISDIEALIDFFSFTAWVFYGATFTALIVMRWTRPDMERPIKIPLVIAVVVTLISIYLVIAPIVDDPQLGYLYAALIVFAGILFYVPFVYFKIHLHIFDKITVFMQVYLEVAPGEHTD
ncbi:PREDICTED: b(0,+)-type amino acid transporter 1-like isoform X2 [Priapulus caudatus]|uniref:B(0,+)-type amino acid transporter 1-like isoform X2 n=1 Tax=Priapulus caudatus TaxID=37621 RepID=A0ABM1F4S5_PRICU|nr:PREDICTED: b(0,+)-type amino acid transporter 1-like isoform X2 [Priapulus caudatus]